MSSASRTPAPGDEPGAAALSNDELLARSLPAATYPPTEGGPGVAPAREPDPARQSAHQRREALKAAFLETQACVRCTELAATRHKVVFGAGNANADLMFVGEAPGASEDQQGLPFVGQAGKLLDKLLGEIGLARGDVFIANVLKCRPPGNRDPLPVEISNCQEYLLCQVELVQPRVICTLGNFSTKLLRADPAGITRVHGQAEVRTFGRRTVRLYPIFHPAAALYTPRMLETLREDFARLPALLALEVPEQPAPAGSPAASDGGDDCARGAGVPAEGRGGREGPPVTRAGQDAAGEPPAPATVPEAPASADRGGDEVREAAQLGLF